VVFRGSGPWQPPGARRMFRRTSRISDLNGTPAPRRPQRESLKAVRWIGIWCCAQHISTGDEAHIDVAGIQELEYRAAPP